MRSGIAPPDAPFALIEKHRGAMRIAALDRHASRLGLEPGLPLADARGQVPELTAVRYDRAADITLLNRLARLCISYTPSVETVPPRGLLLDITGCAHLHDGEASIGRAVIKRLAKEGVSANLAIANTPDAAHALARFGGNKVRALPIAALDQEEDVHQALRRAGFRSIGDLEDLPPAPLAARFGEALVRKLGRLLGHEDVHIVPQCQLDPITTEMRFAEPIGRSDHVLDAIEILIEQTAQKLKERGDGGRAFITRLYRSDGHVASLTIETSAPTRDPALVLRLLCERIDSLVDPLDPGFGYDAIDLAVIRAEPLAEHQPRLSGKAHQVPEIGPLLDRLAVRYGAHCLLRFTAGDSHVPERAGRLVQVGITTPNAPWVNPDAGEPPLRPLLLFDPPQQIQVLAAVPDGPPRRFCWCGRDYHIVASEGPERIAFEWWRRMDDHAGNPGLTRDYYRVEDKSGHRFWLFRHGLYESETSNPNWYVHGRFA
jgi:protein ImuB